MMHIGEDEVGNVRCHCDCGWVGDDDLNAMDHNEQCVKGGVVRVYTIEGIVTK